MSFERKGFPVTVCAPETTQLLEPRASVCSWKKGWSHGSSNCGIRSKESTALGKKEVKFWPGILREWEGALSNAATGAVGGWSRHEVFTYKSAVNSGPSLARTFSRVSAALGLVLSVSTIW